MSTTTPRARVAAGVPTGGEFAASARAESGVALLQVATSPETFHPGVTNCGGMLAASGCSCARPDGSIEPPARVITRDERAVRDWLPTASDEAFTRLCGETSMWVAVTADHMSEGPSHEPDWYAIRNSYVAGCLARTPHRELPAILLGEIRDRLATDVSPGAAERAKAYEATARSFFHHAPDRLGSPTTANEARGLWRGVQIGTTQDGRGFIRATFIQPGQPGDAMSDPEAARFAVEDTECATWAIEALRNGYRAGSGDNEQFTLRLAASPNHEVRAKVAEAVPWAHDLVPVMAADDDPLVRAVIAGRMGLMAGQANNDPGAKDTDLFQGHTASSPRYQQRLDLIDASQRLARDPDTDVRRALATSIAWTDKKTQRILADDPDPMVRNVLAANAKKSRLDEKAIKTLAKDDKPGVREALLNSGVDIPHRYLKRLVGDRDPMVAAAAGSRLRPATGTPHLVVKDGRIQRDA